MVNTKSAAAAEAALADGVAGILAFAEERLVAHDLLAGMHGLPVGDIGLVVWHAHHQACRLGDAFADQLELSHRPLPSPRCRFRSPCCAAPSAPAGRR